MTRVSARGLRNADEVGKSDPYVRLWVDDVDSQRTTTKVGTLDPVWNEKFTFKITRQNKLHFKIWDSDAPESEGKDDKLASGSVSLENVFKTGKEEKTHELTHNLGLSKDGVITLKLEFVEEGKST
ncbi:elicitor-responsive protein 1-like [Rhizophagus clarus]|uniref:Elicitor-responsive protein 1-like n=1 Tax=Rhizophagus clarus TaxID=94130 RepID=A0A8H3R1K6_9GLOM|nr:elicitor-responsive protein 1-like [Rhizophagus clarus]